MNYRVSLIYGTKSVQLLVNPQNEQQCSHEGRPPRAHTVFARCEQCPLMGTPRGEEHKHSIQQSRSSSYKSPGFMLLETNGEGSRHASPPLLCLASSQEHPTLTRQLSTVFKKSTSFGRAFQQSFPPKQELQS